MIHTNVPAWWQEVTRGWQSQDIAKLRDAVQRAGVSVNDRINVERLWHEILLQRAQQREVQL